MFGRTSSLFISFWKEEIRTRKHLSASKLKSNGERRGKGKGRRLSSQGGVFWSLAVKKEVVSDGYVMCRVALILSHAVRALRGWRRCDGVMAARTKGDLHARFGEEGGGVGIHNTCRYDNFSFWKIWLSLCLSTTHKKTNGNCNAVCSCHFLVPPGHPRKCFFFSYICLARVRVPPDQSERNGTVNEYNK